MNAPLHPIMAQALRGFMPPAPKQAKSAVSGETVAITFLGIPLVAEIDYQGFIEGLKSETGDDCYSALAEWAITEIDILVDKAIKQAKFDSDYDKGEERYNDKELA